MLATLRHPSRVLVNEGCSEMIHTRRWLTTSIKPMDKAIVRNRNKNAHRSSQSRSPSTFAASSSPRSDQSSRNRNNNSSSLERSSNNSSRFNNKRSNDSAGGSKWVKATSSASSSSSFSRSSSGSPFRSTSSSNNTPSSSDVALPVLLDKIETQLSRVWRTGDLTIQNLARDLGMDSKSFLNLAQTFANVALKDLHNRRTELEQNSTPPSVSPEQRSVEWDLERFKTSYIELGQQSIQQTCLRMFVVWASTLPLPPPVVLRDGPCDPAIQANLTLSKLHHLAKITDRRYPGEAYQSARATRRKIIMHVGPTNSGKTHSALVALARARTGAYAGPLRLLAHEVFARLNGGKIGEEGPRQCNLLTGEESRVIDHDAGLTSCTVEMFPVNKLLDVAVVDEIQMIGDSQRGQAWTEVVVGAHCKELHLCGEESVVGLIERIAREMGDEFIVKRYSRLSPLVVAEKSLGGNLSNIKRGDCLVTFSRSNIFAFKKSVEEQTGLKVAVAYGGLPPEVREEQARLFNEGAFDVLVASDAVGMGLNLKVRRIVFESVHKWNGKSEICLPTPQIKQIAGRAGRYGVHAPSSPSAPDDAPGQTPDASDVIGEATCLDEDDMPIIRQALATPTIEITRAALGAGADTFRDVQALLPAETPFSKIHRLVDCLVRTKSDTYTICSMTGAKEISDAIGHVGPLTVDERLLFGNAPVNLRDANVVGTLISFVEAFAAGKPILMEQWKQQFGLQGALDLLDQAKAAKSADIASKSPDSIWDQDASLKAYRSKRAMGTVFTSQFLQQLESFHRCLTLYLWLSYRQWHIFRDRENARLLRRQIEVGIDVVLTGMKFERIARGSNQKRNRAKVGRVDGDTSLFDLDASKSGRATRSSFR